MVCFSNRLLEVYCVLSGYLLENIKCYLPGVEQACQIE